jgi:hypothetical protein
VERTPIILQELEPLPEVIVSYSADTQTLSIHSGAGTADGEDMARGLTVFYDAEGNVAGFVLESTELLLKPLLDVVLYRNGA